MLFDLPHLAVFGAQLRPQLVWSNWSDADLERRMFDAQPGSPNHEKAKYMLEKRRHEREMARRSVSSIVRSSMEPQRGIHVLQRLMAKGRELSSRRPIDSTAAYGWAQTTSEVLISCFGTDSSRPLINA